MPAGTFTLYDHVSELLGDATIDLDDHAFKAMLVTSAYTFSAAHTQYSNASGSEVANGNGYTTTGLLLTGVAWTRASGITTFTSNPAVWAATGAGITARAIIIYDDTIANDLLLGYMLLDATPANVSVTAGNNLTISPHATQGWFQNTVNI